MKKIEKVAVKSPKRESEGTARACRANLRKKASKSKKSGKKRRLSASTRKALQERVRTSLPISTTLGSILGGITEVSRPEATRGVWKYIKDHNLQDPEDGRIVRCDSTLKRVFGDEDYVHILQIPKLLNRCFIEGTRNVPSTGSVESFKIPSTAGFGGIVPSAVLEQEKKPSSVSEPRTVLVTSFAKSSAGNEPSNTCSSKKQVEDRFIDPVGETLESVAPLLKRGRKTGVPHIIDID